jgi:hypothetical protein
MLVNSNIWIQWLLAVVVSALFALEALYSVTHLTRHAQVLLVAIVAFLVCALLDAAIFLSHRRCYHCGKVQKYIVPCQRCHRVACDECVVKTSNGKVCYFCYGIVGKRIHKAAMDRKRLQTS